MRLSSPLLLAPLAAVTVLGCSGDAPPPADPQPTEVAGECADAFGADICTWAVMEGETVVEVGATVPLASIEAAPIPTEMPTSMPWPPPNVAEPALPPEATAQVGLTHMTMNWEPMGHTPATYMTPHFDFHFYLMPTGERQAIDCSNTAKPSTLPAGYSLPDEQLPPEIAAMIGVETLIGVCVPTMGMHALVTEEMQVETLFDGTMIVGYYDQQPIFVEPMISQAYLMRRQSFDLPIPQIPGLAGTQPTTFRAVYDADADAYRFTWGDFSE